MLGNRFAKGFRKWIYSNPYRKWAFLLFIIILFALAILKNLGWIT